MFTTNDCGALRLPEGFVYYLDHRREVRYVSRVYSLIDKQFPHPTPSLQTFRNMGRKQPSVFPDFPSGLRERFDPEIRRSLAKWRRVASHHEGRATARATRSLASAVDSHAYCSNKVITSRYTLLTFVPLNFFEQLQRPLNFYFVFLVTLLCFPEIAPVSPLTMIIPLALAFSLSGMKEGVDDYRRHQGDKKTNSRLYRVYNPDTKSFSAVFSQNLRVGDVILMLQGDEVPCDIVPLLSSDPHEGTTFCNTSNLDGEADSKPKHCILAGIVSQMRSEDSSDSVDIDGPTAIDDQRQQLAALPPLECEGPTDVQAAPDVAEAVDKLEAVLARTVVDCEPPSRSLTSFHGTATVFDRPLTSINPSAHLDIHSNMGQHTASAGISEVPLAAHVSIDALQVPHVQHRIALSVNELLVSTSVISSMPFTFGIAVYTGNEAKIHRSRRAVPVKWSVIDRLTNRFALAVFVIQFLMVVGLCVLGRLQASTNSGAWYLQAQVEGFVDHYLYLPLTTFLLLSIMVPLSVKVILELSKFYISELIEWDVALYDEETDVAASVNSRALSEELGLVQYVMADKTGTLTENTMILKRIAFATSAANATHDDSGIHCFSLPLPRPRDGDGPGISLSEVSMQSLMGQRRAGHARSESGQSATAPNIIDRVRAAEMWEREPLSLELAYAIAANNTCEVSLLPGGSRQLSRTSSRIQLTQHTPPVSHPATPLPNGSYDGKHGGRTYASTSPDEVALVEKLADELGFVLLRRNKKFLSIRRPVVSTSLQVPDTIHGLSASRPGSPTAELSVGFSTVVEKWEAG
jgi:magnesium-transporting ATPase (P-type)